MSDELNDTTNDTLGDADIADVLDDEEKEAGDADIDPTELSADEPEDLAEDDAVVSPEEDPFGFGAFGELNEDGEFVAPAVDDDEEVEDEVSEDLF